MIGYFKLLRLKNTSSKIENSQSSIENYKYVKKEKKKKFKQRQNVESRSFRKKSTQCISK